MRVIPLLLLASAMVWGAATVGQTETIAGTGVKGYSGDGGRGVQAQLNNPYGLVTGPDGALYICDVDNHVIRRLDLKSGVITTVAGNGRKGYSGDGGPAKSASLNEPYEVRFDRAGHMYFVERMNHVVRKVDRKTGIISTVAGTGEAGYGGDGGPAVQAQLRQPHSISFDPQGRLLICDILNHRVRRLDLKTGMIETYLGTGDRLPTPDGAPVAGTPVNGPRAIDLDEKGNLYLALREGNALYKIDASTGKYVHLAGTGQQGYSGDGGPAKLAKLAGPKGVAYSRHDRSVYIADTESHTIRKIDLRSGIITTVIGTGERGDGPDGDPLRCKTARPHGVFIDKDGVLYVGDSEAHRVRRMRLR